MKKLLATIAITASMFTTSVSAAEISLTDIWNELTNAAKTVKNSNETTEFIDSVSKTADDIFSFYKSVTTEATNENIPTANVGTTAELANLEYKAGDATVVTVNDNKADFIYDFVENRIDYSPLDEYNRVGTVTAYLTKQNVGSSKNREGQTFMPTGFHKNGQVDRGHLIAYTLSFNFNDNGVYTEGELGSIDNPKNLATQTDSMNRGDMQTYETLVRDQLKTSDKVIYKVTPVFRGSELMARGFWLQALSQSGDLEFSVYIFNVKEGYTFDYATGRARKN